MNKHLDNAKEFLGIMTEMLSEKKDEDDIAHLKDKIAMQEWLIEQAERVQELEEENEQLKDYVNRMENEYIHGVKEENKRYREALEFYANKENYVKHEYEPLNPKAKNMSFSDIDLDGGELARQALRGETDECT